eukprot:scaffold23509_cov59-Phaeocystis_antarctica.AAC.2
MCISRIRRDAHLETHAGRGAQLPLERTAQRLDRRAQPSGKAAALSREGLGLAVEHVEHRAAARGRQQRGGEDAAVAGQLHVNARRLGAADGVDAEERARRLGAGVGV